MSIRTISDKLMTTKNEKIYRIDIEEPIDRDLETLQRMDKVLKKLDQIENM